MPVPGPVPLPQAPWTAALSILPYAPTASTLNGDRLFALLVSCHAHAWHPGRVFETDVWANLCSSKPCCMTCPKNMNGINQQLQPLLRHCLGSQYHSDLPHTAGCYCPFVITKRDRTCASQEIAIKLPSPPAESRDHRTVRCTCPLIHLPVDCCKSGVLDPKPLTFSYNFSA